MATRKSQPSRRKTSKSSQSDVKTAMHKAKRGQLRSGSGRKVKSRKQAIAIGLSEARSKGKKVPRKGAPRKRAARAARSKPSAAGTK